tara:strand:- start:1013 stop:1258 length:246 start_codon:yes stop_codon:yes gene_type:complete
MSRAEEIKSLQKLIKVQNEKIERLKQDKHDLCRTVTRLRDSNDSTRRVNEDNRVLERSNDYLRGVIANLNQGLGLYVNKQA